MSPTVGPCDLGSASARCRSAQCAADLAEGDLDGAIRPAQCLTGSEDDPGGCGQNFLPAAPVVSRPAEYPGERSSWRWQRRELSATSWSSKSKYTTLHRRPRLSTCRFESPRCPPRTRRLAVPRAPVPRLASREGLPILGRPARWRLAYLAGARCGIGTRVRAPGNDAVPGGGCVIQAAVTGRWSRRRRRVTARLSTITVSGSRSGRKRAVARLNRPRLSGRPARI